MRGGIDVVICLDDASDITQLRRCVFALTGQAFAVGDQERLDLALTLHVMLNRFSRAEIEETRAAIQSVRSLAPNITCELHNWEYPEPFELRLPLLNWGLSIGVSRYVTVLEPADMLSPGALARLLGRLRQTNAAAAVGRLAVRTVLIWGEVVLPVGEADGADRCGTPEWPIAFLIDRMRVPAGSLAYRAGVVQGEATALTCLIGEIANVDAENIKAELGVREILAAQA